MTDPRPIHLLRVNGLSIHAAPDDDLASSDEEKVTCTVCTMLLADPILEEA